VAGGRRSDGQGPFWGRPCRLNPTDRAKNGVKRSLLVEADGGPLAVVVAGANVRDDKLLAATLDAIVVEPTLGWLSKYRAILVHYEKKATNYLG
jgi:hypothetical protein